MIIPSVGNGNEFWGGFDEQMDGDPFTLEEQTRAILLRRAVILP